MDERSTDNRKVLGSSPGRTIIKAQFFLVLTQAGPAKKKEITVNQETLKDALRYSEELVKSAKRAQRNIFERLSPDCEYRFLNKHKIYLHRWACRKRVEEGVISPDCSDGDCPLYMMH